MLQDKLVFFWLNPLGRLKGSQTPEMTVFEGNEVSDRLLNTFLIREINVII